jgi:hypothetical protein
LCRSRRNQKERGRRKKEKRKEILGFDTNCHAGRGLTAQLPQDFRLLYTNATGAWKERVRSIEDVRYYLAISDMRIARCKTYT